MSADGNDIPVKMGRPPKLVETPELIKQIEGLSRIHCTMVEAAAVLGVHRDTFSDFLQAHEKAMAAWEDGKENGKASLRRMQFKAAESGNSTMQIWLGKQWLDQKDKFESSMSLKREIGDYSTDELRAIAGIRSARVIEAQALPREPDSIQ